MVREEVLKTPAGRAALARWLLALTLGWLTLTSPARAAVVSRLGSIYLYDPISFDSGVLQRGVYARGGAGSEAGGIDTGMELTFFHEFSLRLGYTQRFLYDGQPDPLGFGWRARMPVFESLRYGRLDSAGFIYSGATPLGEPIDTLTARHVALAAHVSARSRRLLAHSFHGQAGFGWRGRDQAPEAPRFARVGPTLRVAHLVQIYQAAPGLGGHWTATASTLELSAQHYGLTPGAGGEGRLQLGTAGLGLHFTPSIATYSFGLMPRVTLEYGPDRADWSVGGLASFSVTYRPEW